MSQFSFARIAYCLAIPTTPNVNPRLLLHITACVAPVLKNDASACTREARVGTHTKQCGSEAADEAGSGRWGMRGAQRAARDRQRAFNSCGASIIILHIRRFVVRVRLPHTPYLGPSFLSEMKRRTPAAVTRWISLHEPKAPAIFLLPSRGIFLSIPAVFSIVSLRYRFVCSLFLFSLFFLRFLSKGDLICHKRKA